MTVRWGHCIHRDFMPVCMSPTPVWLRTTSDFTMEVTDDVIRNLSTKASLPLVFRQFVKDWPICAWDENKWTSIFGEKEIPFRCLKKSFVSDEPCWERRCQVKKMTFSTFIGDLNTSQDWMYFDYKYLHQWFSSDSELCKVKLLLFILCYIIRAKYRQKFPSFANLLNLAT